MKVIIHDMEDMNFNKMFEENMLRDDKEIKIISNNGKIKGCIGCFCCWTKTPGVCILKDEYNNIGEILSKANEVIIISKCIYGSYSPFVKNILDRSIPYLLPFFKIQNKEIHHKIRYKNRFNLKVYFYGENITEEEKDTAKKLIKANKLNINFDKHDILFRIPEEL